MSDQPTPTLPNPDVPEPDRPPLAIIAIEIAVLALLVLGASLGLAQLYKWETRKAIQKVRLSVDDPRLAEVRAKAEGRLTGYGQLDAEAGLYRIPIEEAMKNLAGDASYLKSVPPSLADEKAAERKKEWSVGKEWGAFLYKEKICITCHSVDGTKLVGPSLAGRFGKKIELSDGSMVMMDEAYIKESITQPLAKVSKGFPPAMPPIFATLSEDEIQSLVEFVKSLGE